MRPGSESCHMYGGVEMKLNAPGKFEKNSCTEATPYFNNEFLQNAINKTVACTKKQYDSEYTAVKCQITILLVFLLDALKIRCTLHYLYFIYILICQF